MTETGKSFWHTAAGMITAVAALITALGGVLAILVQNDVIGGSREVAGSPGGGGTDPTVAGVTTKASPQVPWAQGASVTASWFSRRCHRHRETRSWAHLLNPPACVTAVCLAGQTV